MCSLFSHQIIVERILNNSIICSHSKHLLRPHYLQGSLLGTGNEERKGPAHAYRVGETSDKLTP